MKIGLIGAMRIEIEELLKKTENIHKRKYGKLTFYDGKISGCNCVLAQCEPGKVNAAICAQTMLLKYKPDAIINIGVAGGIGKDVKIGDIVLSTHVVQHDMNTEGIGDEIGFISGLGEIYMSADAELLELAKEEAEKLSLRVHQGTIASGDIFLADPSKILKIKKRFSALACDMEGGAIGHVARVGDTPFLVIRSISDNANDAAKVDYPRFAASSAKIYGRLIENMLARIAYESEQ